MLVFEQALACHAVGHLPLEVHHQFQHLVVGLPGKYDLSRVQLKQSATHRPHVDGIFVLTAHDCRRKKWRRREDEEVERRRKREEEEEVKKQVERGERKRGRRGEEREETRRE